MKFIRIFTIIGLFVSFWFYGCAQKDILAKKSLKNLTYKNETANFGSAALKDGKFTESVEPGSASKIVVKLSETLTYGEINGERAVAVILVTNSAGSGVFYDLAIITEQMKKSDKVSTINLGDRIKIDSIVFNSDTVYVDLLTQADGEPMVTHSKKEIRKFIVGQNGSIEEVKRKQGNGLKGTKWKLMRVAYANDTEKKIDDSERYTLVLSEDKKVNIQADCNRGFGSYTLNGSSLKISILGSTRAMCPPESFSDKYISELGAVVSYMLKGEKLYLSLKIDSGIMEFVK